MKYADIIDNDVVNGTGICVSVWMGGCPHRCEGCHNPELWDYNKNKDVLSSLFLPKIEELLNKNGINRNLSILGGEPLCPENLLSSITLMSWFKKNYPNRQLFVWTGYTEEELKNSPACEVFKYADFIIEGRYEKEHRNVALPLRGSTNQRILARGIDF